MDVRVRYQAGALALRGLGVLVFLFLTLPVIAIIPLSFTSGLELVYPVPGYSLRWYADFFTRPEWLFAFKNSLFIGTCVTLLATTLGTLGAFGLQKLGPRTQAVASNTMVLPMAVPVVIAGVAFFFFYASIGLTGTYSGIIFAHTTMALPFVLISVRASLSGLNPDLARAAASLGARPHRVFARVIAPVVMPGIATGALFAFAVSLDDVVIAMYLGGPQQLTLPRQMFAGVRENVSPTVLSASSLMVLFSVLLMVATGLLSRRSRALGASKALMTG